MHQTKGANIANELIDTHLYVISELPIEEKYYPLLLFAAGKKREEVLQAFVARREMEYIQIALILYPETMRRIYTMPKGDYPTIEENLNVLIDLPFCSLILLLLNPFTSPITSQERE